MSQPIESHPKNYVRRTVGTILCFIPALVAIASLWVGLSGWVTPSTLAQLAGRGCVFVAAFVTAINLYLSVLRPSFFRRRHGPSVQYRGPSIIPVFGDILVVLGSLVSFGGVSIALIALLVVALNTGGLPWLLFATWRDSGLWDSPQRTRQR